jgi:sigma-B regulation protein RsbU (phosphoserine phosphatase)
MQKDLKSYIEHLKETTSAKEKIESELRIAREIQMGMIPKIFPPFPDIPEIDIYAMLEPAKEVGGDLYDFFLIDDKHLCIALGDVSGKGVPASLFMAVTRTLLRSVAPKQRSPKVIVDALNKSLSLKNESSMFVTFFLGIINIETGYYAVYKRRP